jgi:hypothetical protein
MKYQLQISYTNILLEHLCSLSNSIGNLKPNDISKCRTVCHLNC